MKGKVRPQRARPLSDSRPELGHPFVCYPSGEGLARALTVLGPSARGVRADPPTRPLMRLVTRRQLVSDVRRRQSVFAVLTSPRSQNRHLFTCACSSPQRPALSSVSLLFVWKHCLPLVPGG